MSQNPFDGLLGGQDQPGGQGGDLAGALGGMDLGGLLQQAQQMQQDLQEAQQRLADATVEGSVAGGAVAVTLTGAGELTDVRITPDAITSTEPADLADLGDLVVAAFRDARSKVDELAEQTLGPLAGGVPGLPGSDPGEASGQLGF